MFPPFFGSFCKRSSLRSQHYLWQVLQQIHLALQPLLEKVRKKGLQHFVWLPPPIQMDFQWHPNRKWWRKLAWWLGWYNVSSFPWSNLQWCKSCVVAQSKLIWKWCHRYPWWSRLSFEERGWKNCFAWKLWLIGKMSSWSWHEPENI